MNLLNKEINATHALYTHKYKITNNCTQNYFKYIKKGFSRVNKSLHATVLNIRTGFSSLAVSSGEHLHSNPLYLPSLVWTMH